MRKRTIENLMTVGIVVLFFVFLLTGCAGTVTLNERDRASIHKVNINSTVAVIESRHMMFPVETVPVGGAIGGAMSGLAASRAAKQKELIANFMRENGIHIGQIVRKQFKATVRRNDVFPSVVVSDSEFPIFKLNVTNYGFNKTGIPFTSTLNPQLCVRGKLVAADGTILWRKRSMYLPLFKRTAHAHTLEEYLNEPKLLREAFEDAAEKVTRKLVNHLAH